MSDDDLRAAWARSSRHRAALLASRAAQCFHCLASYPVAAIVAWCDDGATALCPRCGVDAVIPDAGGAPLDEAFLRRMRAFWFDRIVAMLGEPYA